MRYTLRISLVALCFSSLFMLLSANAAQKKPTWSVWVQQLRVEALQQGITAKTFDRAFRGLKAPNPRVLKLDRNQPEKRLTYLKYRNTRSDAYRIKLGRRALRKHSKLLHEVAAIYGVSPAYIVSFWGLETSYGYYKGKFSVVRSLATLAYDDRRQMFFRRQLIYALKIVDGGHVRLKDFKGEWAGASGHPQFLPTSWYRYAVDHDGDGKKDIWNSMGDVFASIANYLRENGWHARQSTLVEVRTAKPLKYYKHGLVTRKSVSDWQRAGVRMLQPVTAVQPASMASLLRPHGGPTWLVFNNFRVIMRWNRSIYYAGTVDYLARNL